MKKAILSLLVALPLCASAQFKLVHSPVETAPLKEKGRPIYKVAAMPSMNDGTANKGAAATPRWYNHWDALATAYGLTRNDVNLTTAILMWQDSTVRLAAPNTNIGVQWLSAAEFFAPNTAVYNQNNTTNRNKLAVTNQSYKIDSVMIRGFYERPFNSYVDTLVLTFVVDSSAGKFTYLTFTGSTQANHSIDSAAAVLWPLSQYLLPNQMPNGLHQTSYSYTGNNLAGPYRVKVPLTQAIFVDSLSDGSQLIKAAVGITVPARTEGGKISMSVTFKSGTSYTSGSPYTNYNRFFLMSHEQVQDGFTLYPATDQNMSYLASKDSTNKVVSSTLGYYIPTIAFSGTGTSNFNGEVHDISWKVSCASCPTIGGVTPPNAVGNVENNVEIGHAYPNPANTQLFVPVTVNSAAKVTVRLMNLLGEVVTTAELGQIGAGQTKNASFNTSSLAAGTYLYTVESDGFRATERVLIAH